MAESNPRIYLLPNLMTAGNLFCGFGAVLKILEGALIRATNETLADDKFHMAIWFILGACIFDLLDGRVARLGGTESPFGREFDSLADIVSFGVAPALLVYKIVLVDFPRLGWVVASIYLLCGALRLARFNCLAAADHVSANKEFKGFPIPAAAGLIASLTLFMLWISESEKNLGLWRWVLPVLMVFLSFMMFSGVRYPSFKSIDWRTTRSLPKFLIFAILLYLLWLYHEWMPVALFMSYLLYGFLRPWLSLAWRRRIEEEEEMETQADANGTSAENPEGPPTIPPPGA